MARLFQWRQILSECSSVCSRLHYLHWMVRCKASVIAAIRWLDNLADVFHYVFQSDQASSRAVTSQVCRGEARQQQLFWHSFSYATVLFIQLIIDLYIWVCESIPVLSTWPICVESSSKDQCEERQVSAVSWQVPWGSSHALCSCQGNIYCNETAEFMGEALFLWLFL